MKKVFLSAIIVGLAGPAIAGEGTSAPKPVISTSGVFVGTLAGAGSSGSAASATILAIAGSSSSSTSGTN